MGGARTLFIVWTNHFMRVRDNMIVWSGLLLLVIVLLLGKNKCLFSSSFLLFFNRGKKKRHEGQIAHFVNERQRLDQQNNGFSVYLFFYAGQVHSFVEQNYRSIKKWFSYLIVIKFTKIETKQFFILEIICSLRKPQPSSPLPPPRPPFPLSYGALTFTVLRSHIALTLLWENKNE